MFFKRLFSNPDLVQTLSPEEVDAWLNDSAKDIFLLDVRTEAEYDSAHIDGSTLIPVQSLADKITEIPQDKPIVVICRSGNRSRMASNLLARKGFADIYNMRGGLLAWTREGLPVDRQPPPYPTEK